MPKSRIPSPARSQSAIVTPRRAKPRGPRSVGSPARSNTSVRLTSVIQNFKDKNMDSFHLSPLNSRRSVLNDNTDIEEPKRNSWWKKLNDTSRDIMEVLENDKQEEPYNVMEEYMDVEVLSQEKRNPTLDLPDSSNNESISSIVIPQRKLFSQKENQPQPQNKFAQFLGPRESMARLNKTSGASDKSEKTIVAGTKKLFGQSSKQRTKPAFPTELLKFSPDKTVNKTAGEIKGQVRNLFGNRAGVKRKNNFADFIASESEEESEIQPKVFGFQKKTDVPSRRVSTASRGNRDHSPTSSVTTDIDMEDWKLLPSSTMVQTQLEAMMTDSPAKKARLSKLSEGKESEAATNSTAITNKTKQSNKSVTSKNKSKMSVSKNSMNKSKTSPKRNDGMNIEKTVVSDLLAEHVDLGVENDENEVSLHYSDDDPQEDNLEDKNEKDATNKTKQSNKSATSKMSTSKGSLNKSKISASAKKSKSEADFVEENEIIVNKTKKKNESKLEKADDKVQEEENPKLANEIQETEDGNKISQVEQEDENQINESQEVENENQESEIEQEDEEENESHEMEDENEESEVEQEDEEQENVSQDMGDENQESEVEQEDEEQENVSQDMGDENQESEIEQEDEEQESGNQELETEARVDDDSQNERREVEVENQGQEIENMAVENKAAANGTASKTKLSNQSAISANKSLINKSKSSPEGNITQNVKKSVFNKRESGQDDEVAQDIYNVGQNNQNDVLNKTKHSNESVASKNKSNISVSKNLMNNTSNSPNKSVTSINKSKMSSSKASLSNKSKTSRKSNKNDDLNEKEEDQIDSVDAVMNSQKMNNEKIVDESVESGNALEKEQVESPEVENENVVQNQVSEVEEEEQEIEVMDEANESHEEVNEDEELESEGEREDEGNEEDEDNNEDEDDQNESEEVEVENQSQEIEELSQEVENESQEVENDDCEDEEGNESQEEMDEDVDEQQESYEIMEESDGQNDTENDNHASQEEIIGTDEGTPNVTHDTTGRNRNKNETNVKSPEAILYENTNQIESFTAKGRNTSIRRTSMIKNLNIRPSLAPPRESTGFSDGTKNSSTEGSGWDSHRITKKTLRQTFGRDFTPRKSLRALVMEKSAKRHTEFNVNDVHLPRANSTELPENTRCELPEDTRYEVDAGAHDESKRTRQTTLEMYLQKISKQNMEKKKKLEEQVRNTLKASTARDSNPFAVSSRPFALKRAKPAQTKAKTKAVKTTIPLEYLPQELIEDMKYKPPRRFMPSNASWATKRLYKFLESKLEAKYDYKARVRAEKLVETIYNFTKEVRRHDVAPRAAVDALKMEMARLDVVRTHFDFYKFFHDYMPRGVRVKVNPDVANKIPVPRQGVFADILPGNAFQG